MESEPGIFQRMREGCTITRDDPEFFRVEERYELIKDLLPALNSCTDENGRREIFAKVFGREIDPTVNICTPFSTDWGLFTTIGKRTFINSGCTLLDQGGIEIGEDVMFGPQVMLVTTNHPLDPTRRTDMVHEKITIGDNVWIGADSMVLPGVAVGRDAVIAAGSLVTRDVPPRTLVMGRPARVVREL
ncbi:MAG: sugar O-acetyltransferase [archaeon]|nr:sugar O-acetyltransferase [archaeon]